MYRNIYYQCNEDTNWQGLITLDTWDESGERITKTFEYPSHLYYVDNTKEKSKYTTITGKPLTYLEFGNIFARRKWINEHPKVKLYDCLDPVTGFLHDNFYTINEEQDFAEFPLKIYSWDIETAVSEGFPDYNNPRDPLTVQTMSNIMTNESWTWVLLAGNWKGNLTEADFKDTDKRHYFVFKTEKEAYIHFLNWFKHNRPDIITGWNIDSFDVPYTVNRIAEILSLEDVANAFSPIGVMRKKFIKPTVKSRGYDSYRFEGLTILDYMQLYRDKFCKDSMVIDHKLETVCQEELGVGKLHYEGTFKQFYLRDFKTFVEYNIIDVIRINDLERKKKLLALTRYMCNASLCTYDKIFAAQPIVMGALNLLARKNNQLLMSDDRVDPELKTRPFEGAYVFAKTDYKCGPFTTFDLNSLYPNIIISVNISPETKVGKVEGYDTDEWTVKIGDKVKTFSKQAFINKFGATLNIAPNGALFLKQHIKEGICSQYEKKFYSGRKQTKKLMLQKQVEASELLEQIKQEDPNFDEEDPMSVLDTDIKKKWKALADTADYLEIKQLGEKLNLNSLYGLFSSKFSPICDVDCGEAITSSGRVIIQNSMKYLNNELNKINNSDEFIDYVNLVDTDSVSADSIVNIIDNDKQYNIDIESLFNKYKNTLVSNNKTGKEYVFPKLQTSVYNPNIKQNEVKDIQYIYRHKVNKEQYLIIAETGESVKITKDHSIMVERAGKLIECKPEDLQKDDLLIIND